MGDLRRPKTLKIRSSSWPTIRSVDDSRAEQWRRTKLQLVAPDACDRARRLADAGLRAQGPRIDWPALMAFKRSFTDPVPRRRAEEYTRAGIDALRGAARFVGPDAVEVEGVGRLEGRHVLIG